MQKGREEGPEILIAVFKTYFCLTQLTQELLKT